MVNRIEIRAIFQRKPMITCGRYKKKRWNDSIETSF